MLRLFAAALAAIVLIAAGPARAEMKTEWVEYGHGDTKLKAYMAYDDKMTGRRPAVFVVHAREGMTPKTLQLAESWAKLGYVSDLDITFLYQDPDERAGEVYARLAQRINSWLTSRTTSEKPRVTIAK